MARSPGIALAVRCIFASPGGLDFDLVLQAVGVQAEAASRQTFGERPRSPASAEVSERIWPGGSEPELVVEVDGRSAVAYPYEQSSSGGEDEFTSEMRLAVPELPSDGLVTLAVSWPQAGLAKAAVTLTLESLDDLEDRVVHLLA